MQTTIDASLPHPRHNPLIAPTHNETLINVHCALAAVQEFTRAQGENELTLSLEGVDGLLLFIKCMKAAMRYEIEQRAEATQALENMPATQ